MPKRRKMSITRRKTASKRRAPARRSRSRGGRAKRPTIAKVMKRVKGTRSRPSMLKKATDFALNTAESALDRIL